MVNLGANAVKFTAKDKKVVLKCDMLGQDDESMLVRFVLEDEGIGIKESNRQCIFEAFNQGGRSTDADKQMIKDLGRKVTVPVL